MCTYFGYVIMSICLCAFFFFFKQKTAYEMRISDWSSDVCSSDLLGPSFPPPLDLAALLLVQLARLFPQPLRAKAARRRQQVGMVIALVALATRCMDRHVHRHPMPLADFPREAQGQLPALVGRQLDGQ